MSLKKIKESANVAQASEFIEKLDNKYNSLVARSGTNLSGGQKQRIAIARAIARNPEIYIFDDTIMNADKIIVLDNGNCVGIGTHKELLKTCDVYKEIALSQLKEDELNA